MFWFNKITVTADRQITVGTTNLQLESQVSNGETLGESGDPGWEAIPLGVGAEIPDALTGPLKPRIYEAAGSLELSGGLRQAVARKELRHEIQLQRNAHKVLREGVVDLAGDPVTFSQDSVKAEALRVIVEFDLSELLAIEPPRGFGRD